MPDKPEENKENSTPVEIEQPSPQVLDLWNAYAKCSDVHANREDKVLLKLIATGLLEYFVAGVPDEHKENEIKQFALDAIVNSRLKKEIKDYELSLVAGTGGIICKKDDITLTLKLFEAEGVQYEIIEGDADKAEALVGEFLDAHTNDIIEMYNETVKILSQSKHKDDDEVEDEKTPTEDDSEETSN